MSEEYTGKDVSYYLVTIHKPKRLDPYTAECEDIIEALGMSFAEGCAFKAIWRKCAARTLGLAKAGYKGGLYDAEKTQYYGARMVAAEQPISCPHCGVSEGSLHHPDCHLMRRGKSRLVGVYSGIARNAHQLAAVLTGPCSECGFPKNHDGTHYATCSQLTAPDEYKAEAQAAFEEAARPHMLNDYEEWICRDCGAVHTRIGNLQQRVGPKPCKPWCPEPGSAEEPASEINVHFGDQPATPIVHNDMDEERVDIVASSHGDGEHYDDPWAGAPGWVSYRAQDADGALWWFEKEPIQTKTSWVVAVENQFSGYARCNGDREPTPNPNWRDTLIERPNNKSQE